MAELRSASTERPGWPPLAMLKALLLAQWHGLSDPELEDAIADRLSFRRFVGLPQDGVCRTRRRSAGSGTSWRDAA